MFEPIKNEHPNYLEKISTVIGDCELPNLGIPKQYQEILKKEVTIKRYYYVYNKYYYYFYCISNKKKNIF